MWLVGMRVCGGDAAHVGVIVMRVRVMGGGLEEGVSRARSVV